MRWVVLMLGLVVAVCSQAHARDSFGKVRCDGDIAKALIGERGSNEPVVKVEARHKDLKLKDLGADDYGSFSAVNWMICGRKFIVLEDNRTAIVHDVLEVPAHTKAKPEFQGVCNLNGKPMPETVIAILRDETAGKHDLPADAVWKIDEKAVRFVKMPTDDLLCPRDGIVAPPTQP